EMVDDHLVADMGQKYGETALSIQQKQADTVDGGPLRFLDDIVPSNILFSTIGFCINIPQYENKKDYFLVYRCFILQFFCIFSANLG
ncbi:MAG: hypothetical protein IJ288_06535, partial [Alistipes sp.]|nr:hypothetical protein [Alistipes sp.]